MSYRNFTIKHPQIQTSQLLSKIHMDISELLYGDLVFFAADGENVNHVGIYVGNGEFVHAPSTGNVVKNSSLISGYYQRTYFTARRVIKESM